MFPTNRVSRRQDQWTLIETSMSFMLSELEIKELGFSCMARIGTEHVSIIQ